MEKLTSWVNRDFNSPISHKKDFKMTIRKIVKWASIAIVAVVVIVVAAIFMFPGALAGPTAPPLQLPELSTAAMTESAPSPDGTWIAGSGSLAGFRVDESFLVQSGTIVGRTSAVTGSLVVADNAVSSGAFQVDLSKLTLGGKPNASFFKILDTSTTPNATLTLMNPIVFTNIPSNGQTISSSADGTLTMHGFTQPVTFTFTGRYDGSVLEATGSAPVLATDWRIDSPFGIHNNDVIEFLVILQRA